MAYNILAINPGHNGSAALVSDGNLVFYAEEERISRMKYDGNPFRAMLQILNTTQVDELVIGGTSAQLSQLPWTMEDAYTALVRKFNPRVKVTIMGHQHHLGHAAGAFYNSGFTTAVAIVVDGAGSYHQQNINERQQTGGFETESIYKCSYPAELEPLYKRYSDGNSPYFKNAIQEFDNSVTITKAYEAVSSYLGFGYIEAGKTMGLAPYGKDDPDIPDFFVEDKGNKNLLMPMYPAGSNIDEDRFPYLKRTNDPKAWHTDAKLVRDIDKNLAYKIQKQSEEQLIKIIEKAVAMSGETNVVISGGYGLNCVANYKFIKRFPNLKIYVDPIAHDGGTSIGLARLAWHQYSSSKTVAPLQSVYLGAMPDYGQLDEIVKNAGLKSVLISHNQVAEIIEQGNIVTLFQGRAEGGPRALGNRSILFDPRHPEGKAIVNRVKKREWFRPFAGSVMEEHADNWFDMAGMKSSPFMMYAVDVKPEKVNQVPAITHVDDTCRIQTVSAEQNFHYYKLINAFYKKTGIPILMNTSFNLAGEPLVENLIDAIITLLNSEIKYLYLPEAGKLITK